MSSFKIAVFVSGNGSNLQSLIDTNKIKNEHSLDIAVVFSNNKDALALKRAKNIIFHFLFLIQMNLVQEKISMKQL